MNSRDIVISSLFGVIIFLDKALLPPPYDKAVSVMLQIVFLSLAYMIVGFSGPILTGVVSGLLISMMRPGMAWMTFTFAILYGILVGCIYRLFGVVDLGRVRMGMLIVSALFSTIIVGVLSSAVSIFLGLIPYNVFIVSMIMFAGVIQGIAGGVLSFYLFEKHIRRLIATYLA